MKFVTLQMRPWRGLRRVQVGSGFYCAVEARVVAQLIAHEVDLSEVAAQIEEARWEANYL